MPRRAHLALALILVLALAPLARASCGIGCLAAMTHDFTPAAMAPSHCVRATACCHSSGPAICAATQSPESIATLLSAGTNSAPEASAVPVPAGKALSQDSCSLAARSVDGGAPPGPTLSSSPLRI